MHEYLTAKNVEHFQVTIKTYDFERNTMVIYKCF